MASDGNGRLNRHETCPIEFYDCLQMHTALDAIEERFLRKNQSNDQYLGLLLPIDEYRIFGFLSNSKVKFLIAIRDVYVRESEAKQVAPKRRPL